MVGAVVILTEVAEVVAYLSPSVPLLPSIPFSPAMFTPQEVVGAEPVPVLELDVIVSKVPTKDFTVAKKKLV